MSDDLKTPERIWACLSINSKNGTVVLLGHAHYNLSGWQEYIRADRIEQLERGMDALQDRLDTANRARANAMSLTIKKQAKLDKALEALRETTQMLSQCTFTIIRIKGQYLERYEVLDKANAVLAEMK